MEQKQPWICKKLRIFSSLYNICTLNLVFTTSSATISQGDWDNQRDNNVSGGALKHHTNVRIIITFITVDIQDSSQLTTFRSRRMPGEKMQKFIIHLGFVPAESNSRTISCNYDLVVPETNIAIKFNHLPGEQISS